MAPAAARIGPARLWPTSTAGWPAAARALSSAWREHQGGPAATVLVRSGMVTGRPGSARAGAIRSQLAGSTSGLCTSSRRVIGGGSSAPGQPVLQAVEDDLQAELEAVLGRRAVAGRGRVQPSAQSREPGRDLVGSGHAVTEQRRAIAAVLAELPGQRGLRGRAEGVAEDER